MNAPPKNTSSDSTRYANTNDLMHCIIKTLETIPDPEMPISITDLGLVENIEISKDGSISIDILPTMIGCPALAMIQSDIENQISKLSGVKSVKVTFINDPPWTVDRITDKGRADLRKFGVTVPDKNNPNSPNQTVELRTTAPPKPDTVITCPFCGSTNTKLDSPFGPTRCRSIYLCKNCNNTFEQMKRL